MKLPAFTVALCVTLAPYAVGEEIMRADSSWDGGAIAYPPGAPEITSIILRVGEGELPPFHCHPVPTLGYMLRGALEVETRSGRKTVIREGEALVEVMRTVHRGRALDGPAEAVVFYAGAKSLPITVLPEDDPDNQYCDD